MVRIILVVALLGGPEDRLGVLVFPAPVVVLVLLFFAALFGFFEAQEWSSTSPAVAVSDSFSRVDFGLLFNDARLVLRVDGEGHWTLAFDRVCIVEGDLDLLELFHFWFESLASHALVEGAELEIELLVRLGHLDSLT